MKKVFVYCPGNVLSGGVYSLHNLCARLAEAGFDAGMVYHSIVPGILHHENILAYNVTSFVSVEDAADNILVVPETEILFMQRFAHIKKVIYWLGLNNYFKKPPFRRPFQVKLFRKAILCRNYFGYSAGMTENLKRRLSWWAKSKDRIWHEPVIHLSNSFYVALCLQAKGVEKVQVLHNPVQDDFYNVAGNGTVKMPGVIFGPKTPKILIALCRLFFSFRVVRLKHLSPEQVMQHMKETVVFAEFGNNSGRDRMPREAALLGCVVFSNIRGSAAVHGDMPIPDIYKIPDKWINFPGIMKRLRHCVIHYETVKNDFREYVKALEEERINFPGAVKRIFTEIMEQYNL